MTRDEFNRYCAAKCATHHVVQWGNADVWKVGHAPQLNAPQVNARQSKVFALCGWNEGRDAFTFKVTEMVFDLLQREPGYRPAPYMASRGMTWLQIHEPDEVPEADIRQHIDVSYDLVVAKLTRKTRAELGLGA